MVKNLPAVWEGDLGLIPELRRSPGEGHGYSLQYSGLENSMDYIVHGVAKSWPRLSDFTDLSDAFSVEFMGFWVARGTVRYEKKLKKQGIS